MYGSTGSCLGEVYGCSCRRLCCSAILCCLNQEVKFLYKKKQMPNELLYRTQLKSASQWQVMWLCVEPGVNMKFYKIIGILYDRWNTS